MKNRSHRYDINRSKLLLLLLLLLLLFIYLPLTSNLKENVAKIFKLIYVN